MDKQSHVCSSFFTFYPIKAIKGINQSKRRWEKEEVDEEEGGRRLHAFIQASQACKLGPLNMPVAMATLFQPPSIPLSLSLHFPPFSSSSFSFRRLNRIGAIFSMSCDA